MSTAFTVWLTGLPSSGKSAVGELVAQAIAEGGSSVEFISSGRLRKSPLGASLGFSRDDRDTNVRRHAFAASLLVKNGVVAVVSAVSPFEQTRQEVAGSLGRFHLVHVATPRVLCIERDRTGNWERALRGEIRNFTGVDGPYEVPLDAALTVDLSKEEPAQASARVLRSLEDRGWLQPAAAASESDADLTRRLGALGYLD